MVGVSFKLETEINIIPLYEKFNVSIEKTCNSALIVTTILEFDYNSYSPWNHYPWLGYWNNKTWCSSLISAERVQGNSVNCFRFDIMADGLCPITEFECKWAFNDRLYDGYFNNPDANKNNVLDVQMIGLNIIGQILLRINYMN